MTSTSTIIALLCLASSFFYCTTGLSTSGNRIVDKNGNTILLRGVNRPSFEWNTQGESASLHDYQLMKNWGSNVVRLPLNQAFWLSGAVTYSSSYAATIDQQVTWIKSLGMYVILDLHWSDQGNLGLAGNQQNMADMNSVTFWSQLAAKYKNDEMILFELYNEPHDVAWPIWRNGGSSSFTVGGMQQMYNAVRATGANNIVIAGGLNWAFDLSGVITGGYALTGTNIAYATHPYDYPGKQSGDWDSAFGNLAATYPVIMTEFGQYCATDNYVSDLLAYATKKGIHWTAWAWYVSGCEFPSIINDWNGTPSTIGAIVKNYLSSTAPSVPSTSTGFIAPTAAPASGGASTAGGSSSSSSDSDSGFSESSVSSQAQTVYEDQVQNGWQDWSWATISKSNSPVYSGSSSMAFTLGPYTAVYFHNPTAFAVGSFASLQFSINGGSVSPSNIVVKLYDTSASPVPIGNALALPIPVQANKWVIETISLSTFGVAPNTKVSGIVILYNQNNNGGVIYIDNVALLPVMAVATAAPVAPTAAPVAPTAAPVAPTAAPVAPTTAPVAPTKAPVAPTAAPVAPTKAPVAPTTAPVAPTTAPVRATTAPTSVRGTLSPSLSPTIRPTVRATAAPGVVPAATAADTFGDSGSTGGCSATSIVISQSLVSSWQVGADVFYQYSTSLTNLCSNKKVISLTLTPTANWNPIQFWNIEATGDLLTTPSYITIAINDAFTNFGYQNKGGMATFKVQNVVFA